MTDRTRFSGLFNAQDRSVTMIGAGGIGSLLAVTLAKMGFNLLIVDDDVVSDVNTGTQLYGDSQVGQAKVDAIAQTLGMFAPDVDLEYVRGRVGVDSPARSQYWSRVLGGEFVISGVDSINSRKEIWAALNQDNLPWFGWYIDLRMSLLDLYAYVVHRDDLGWYDQALEQQDDGKIVDLPCTSKATWFTAAGASMLGGLIMMRILRGEPVNKIYHLNMDTWRTLAV